MDRGAVIRAAASVQARIRAVTSSRLAATVPVQSAGAGIAAGYHACLVCRPVAVAA